jgi:3-oxoadipate enol-lactonase
MPAVPESRTGLLGGPGAQLYVAQAGTGRPLLFLHGLGWDHTLWGPELARYGPSYHVIVGDTRGHGRSDKPPGPYTISLFVADWLAVLDALEADSTCVVGFSQGGMIAMLLALEHPARVSALVLMSTACRSDPARRGQLEARITRAKTEGPAAAATMAAESIFSPRFRAARTDLMAQFVAWRAAMAQEPLFDATRAASDFDVCARLDVLRMPCLVVAGEHDTLTPPAAVREVAEHIPGAHFELVADSGHMIPVEQPGAFHHLLDVFLAQHYPPTAETPRRNHSRMREAQKG